MFWIPEGFRAFQRFSSLFCVLLCTIVCLQNQKQVQANWTLVFEYLFFLYCKTNQPSHCPLCFMHSSLFREPKNKQIQANWTLVFSFGNIDFSSAGKEGKKNQPSLNWLAVLILMVMHLLKGEVKKGLKNQNQTLSETSTKTAMISFFHRASE